MDFLQPIPAALISAAGWFVAIVIAVAGWLFNAYRQRTLQRKQIAVTLLSQNRFQKAWVDGTAAVFHIIWDDPNYDWASLAKKRFTHGGNLQPDELAIFEHLKSVLNYLEFIAVAVLNKAADEDIVRWPLKGYYLILNRKVIGFIETARDRSDNQDLFVNFTTLADKWQKKQDIASAKPKRYRK